MATGGRDNIFTSCRKGDLARVRYLVEKKEVNVNVRDCWDSTPLYYACHCGHVRVVEYLLEHGARCEENTFDGERCIYGALTNEIKCLLLKSKVASMNTWKRDEFDEFCERLLTADEYSDFTLRLVGGKVFKLHRCILSARSPGFNNLFATKWRDLNDVTKPLIDPKVFEEFVKFLYTGKLKFTKDQYGEMVRLAKQCRVQGLVPLLEEVLAQSTSFEQSKRNIKVTTLVLDTPRTKQKLQEDFCAIIDPGIEEDFAREPFLQFSHTTFDEDEDLCLEEDEGLQTYFDICLKVGDARFYCNKVFLCVRCPYFQALFHDYFGEYRETCNKIPIFALRNICAPAMACVIYFIYTNSVFNLNEEIVFDVLEAADMYILPGLKKLCGEYLCKTIKRSNVVDLVETARLRELPRLETRCTEFLAENFCSVMHDENFRNLVIRDANEVECRQETDSIPIIDDIRYHIATHVDSFGYLDESQHILRDVDDFLVELGLEA